MRKLLLGLAVILFCASVHAMAPPRDDGYRWALIVQPEPDPHSDQVRDLLVRSYGYSLDRVIHLQGGAASRGRIESSLEMLYSRIEPDDTLLVVLPMEVREQGGATFMLPADAQPEAPYTWLNLEHVARWLAASRASRTLFVYGACPNREQKGSSSLAGLVDPLALRLQSAKLRGSVEILRICALGPRKSVAEPLAAALNSQAGRGPVRLSSRLLVEGMRTSAAGLQIDLIRVPEYLSDGFNFVGVSRSQTDYKDRYLAARTLADRQAVLSSLVAAARGDRDQEARVVEILLAIAMDPKADIPSEVVAANALTLRLQANESLALISSGPSIEALAVIAIEAADDVAVRRDAISRLSKVPDLYAHRASPAIRAALRDRDASVRQMAIRGAVIAGDERAENTLADLARSRKELVDVRVAAIQALGAIRPTQNRDLLVGLLTDPVPVIRREASLALGSAGPSGDSTTRLLDRLAKDTEASVRAAAAVSISRTVAPNQADLVRSALIAAMHKGPDEVRSSAAFSLGDVGGRAAAKELAGWTTAATVTPDVRIAATEAFGEATSKMNTAELGEATRVLEPLASSNDPGMRRAAVAALVKMGTQAAAEIALRQLDDPDPFVRTVARDAARKSSTAELRKNLENPSPAIRVQTIRLLGQKPPEETVEPLLRKLSDPNSAVRFAAVEVLSRYDFGHYADATEKLVGSADPNVRAAAAALLGNACDRGGGRALLRQFAARPHPEIVRNLGACSGPDESGVVLRASEDKSDPLRRAAVEAMSSNLRMPAFEARLKKMSVEDSVPEIRLAAIEALSPKASSSPWEIVEEPPITLTIVHSTPGRPSVEADVPARTGYNIQDYRWVTTSSSKSFKHLKFRISDDKSRLVLSATFDPAPAQEAALASVSGRLMLFLAPKESK